MHIKFLQKCNKWQFFCGHNILTERVFLTQVSGNAQSQFDNCVGYDKLLSHVQHVIRN
jgi:hypothetical protein